MKELQELHLNLKKEYFEEIKSGEKEFEYREITPYWRKRLTGKTFVRIIIKGGYLTADNALKAMKVGRIAWMGITIKKCEDCGEDLSVHRVVQTKTAQEILGG